MLSETRMLRLWRLAAAASPAVIFVAGFCWGTAPALADDANPLGSVLGLFGQNKPADDTIDYQPRPPLVVPPKLDLPPPQQKAAHGAEWPKDPDAIARRRAEADSRRPAPVASVPPPPGAPDSVLVRMKDDCAPGNTTCIAPEDSVWEKIKATFAGNGKEVVLSGQEPSRDFLIDPPPGYRRPVAVPEVTPQQRQQAQTVPVMQPSATNVTTAPPQQPQQPPAQQEHWGLW